MRILFLGNSQLACLKAAFDIDPSPYNEHDVYWYVTVGGTGPYFNIVDNKLQLIGPLNPRFPPRASPEETVNLPIDFYDAIVISALGYIDGGFCFKTLPQIEGMLFPYKPRANGFTDRYISEECCRLMIFHWLKLHHGFVLLSNIRNFFTGHVIVQPFPLISSSIKSNSNWPLNIMYDDPIRAHHFFCKHRDEYITKACDDVHAKLLLHPPGACDGEMFTKAELMADPDVLHPLPAYGNMVLHQVLETLSAPSD